MPCSFASLLSVLNIVLAPAAPAADTTIVTVELAPGIYLFRSPSAREMWTATNSVAIVNDDDVTVFDSNTRPSTARLIVAEIRRRTSKPVRWLINSHWHMDHWSGNEVYAKAYPGLQIVSTARTRDYMKWMPPKYFVNSIGVPRAEARLDSMIRTGKKSDGTPFTAEERRKEERELKDVRDFAAEMATVTHVLPNVIYDDSLTFWSGSREFRLLSVIGDATASTVLFLPKERILITGDALVRNEDGKGAQPWTLNSYDVTPWLGTLRLFDRLDAAITVPGQGPELRDEGFLKLTIELYQAILDQVHGAMEGGAASLAEVRERIDLNPIRVRFTNGESELDQRFKDVSDGLIAKAYQEAHDGVAGRR